MLLWRPSELSAHAKIKLKLLAVSLVLHSCMLAMLLVVYRGYYAQLHLDVSTASKDVPVVFLPLQKKVGQKMQVRECGNSKKKKLAERATKKSPTMLAEKTSRVQSKKNKQHKKIKKNSEKKVEQKKEEIVQKVVEAVKEVPKEEPAASAVLPALPIPESQPATATPETDALYIGQLEKDALELQVAIEQEIQQHWKPPVGLSDDISCCIKIMVDWNGAVHDAQLEKKSGVRIFDAQARKAVQAMKFPKAAWGKELVIHFS